VAIHCLPEYQVVPYSHILAYLPLSPTISYMYIQQTHFGKAVSASRQSHHQPFSQISHTRETPIIHHHHHQRPPPCHQRTAPPTTPNVPHAPQVQSRRAEEMRGSPNPLPALPRSMLQQRPLTSFPAPFDMWLNTRTTCYFASQSLLSSNFRTSPAWLIRRMPAHAEPPDDMLCPASGSLP
jgi:hypothetical protein